MRAGQLTVPPDDRRSSRAWTGLHGKTLWDWLGLLVVPLALAAIALGFNLAQSARDQRREDRLAARERAIATDRQREETLSAYIREMSDLLLHERLGSPTETESRGVARTLTLTVLRQLDGRRKGLVVRFLFEAGLLTPTGPRTPLWNPVRLRGADLRNASLAGTRFDSSFAELGDADWRGADFRNVSFPAGVDFTRADLRGADFSGSHLGTGGASPSEPTARPRRATPAFINACLSRARFLGADLRGLAFSGARGHDVDFSRTNLEGASFRASALGGVRLQHAKTTGATFPPGWGPTGLKPTAAICDPDRFR